VQVNCRKQAITFIISISEIACFRQLPVPTCNTYTNLSSVLKLFTEQGEGLKP
jgi:hypothetical protein